MAEKSWIEILFGGGGGISQIVDSIFGGVDKFVTSDEDKQKLQLMKAQGEFELQKLAFEAETQRLKDVQSAREMYKTDSGAQKGIAFAFVVAYFFLTAIMLVLVAGLFGFELIKLPEWAIAFVSTIFGAMSTKVSTIVDFYFGSSSGSRNKDDTFAEDVKKIMITQREAEKDA